MINEKLQKELILAFKSESNLKNSMKNLEIYNFSQFNSTQIFKIFNNNLNSINSVNSDKGGNNNIFAETNSKKHFSKVLDMLKSYFYNSKTNHYANIFLKPTNQIELYENRKKAFQSMFKLDFDKLRLEDSSEEIKRILSDIENIDLKISFSKSIYTFESTIQTVLYDEFRISAQLITKKELQEMINAGGSNNSNGSTSSGILDFILVTNEDVFLEADVFSFKDFQKIIIGNIIKKNSRQILDFLDLIDLTKDYQKELLESIFKLSGLKLDIDFDCDKLRKLIGEDISEKLKDVTNKILRLDEKVERINYELKTIISTKKLSLEGEELLEVLNSGNIDTLQAKFRKDIKQIVDKKEKEIIDDLKQTGVKFNEFDYLFSNCSYPLKLDEGIKEYLLKEIDVYSADIEMDFYKRLGSFEYKKIRVLWNYAFWFDFLYGVCRFSDKFKLVYPNVFDRILLLSDAKNMYINNPMPISYGLGVDKIKIKNDNINVSMKNKERISVLTGANSGGKTTLLEMFLQAEILTHMGLGISGSNSSSVMLFDEIIYLKKFTGTQGSGAFEQTIRNLIEILDRDSSKLILIDEFEAITEPGAAAKILIGFLTELSRQNNFCIAVSHLGAEIKSYIDENKVQGIRIDGISATGLDKKGRLVTNHQPQFNELGKSTPELILKRVLQDEKFWKGKSLKSKKILEKII